MVTETFARIDSDEREAYPKLSERDYIERARMLSLNVGRTFANRVIKALRNFNLGMVD